MATKITAKIKCSSTNTLQDVVVAHFGPDYQDGRNKEWALATPTLSLSISVRSEVAEQWGIEIGKTYTLEFIED